MKLHGKYSIAHAMKNDLRCIELYDLKTKTQYVIIYPDGEIEFTYSNQKFSADELVAISELANNAYLLINFNQ